MELMPLVHLVDLVLNVTALVKERVNVNRLAGLGLPEDVAACVL